MFTYVQSVYDIVLKYIENDFEYLIKSFSGQRKEFNNYIEITNTPKNLFSKSDIKLDFSDKYLRDSKHLLKSIKTDLRKNSLNFSANLLLHNEKILINGIEDYRNYGFLRVIIKDSTGNMHMEDINILKPDPEGLEKELFDHIKNSVINIKSKNSIGKHKKFLSTPVILSAQAAGYFVHEILGHILEEDFFNLYKKNYNELKANSKLTIQDSVEDYNNLIGINKIDDVGLETKPILLIKEGKLENILATDINNSFDNKLYGVARRESYRHGVLPRMRGTFILPCDNMCEKDILHNYWDAIFINKAYMGSVDPNKGLYYLNGNGFYVKNGEKRNFIGNLKMQGNISNDLMKIEYIGNDFKMYGSYCQKIGQTVRVAMGSPTISLHDIEIEGNVYGNL